MGYSQAERLELSQKADAARKTMRDVHAEAGAGELTEEQQTRYDAAKADVRSVRAAMQRMDEQDRLDAEFEADMRATSPDNLRPLNEGNALVNEGGQVQDRMVAAGREFLKSRAMSVAAWGDTAADVVAASDDWSDAECIAASPQYRDAFWRLHAGDTSGSHLVNRISADLQVDHDTQAGIFVAPMQFTAGILKARDQRNVLARDARRISVRNARALGVRKRTAKASTFGWGSELAEPSIDTSLAYGGKELTPHDWSAEARISRNLLAQSVVGIESEVIGEINIDIAEGVESAVSLGTGAQQPLGVFVASDDGITTSRDFGASDNSTTAVTFAGLKDTKWAMHRYWQGTSLKWYGGQEFFEQIDDLTASTGELIWRESVREGEAGSLLGLPWEICEAAPSTFTAGNYVGGLFDMGLGYYVADALTMTVQRLTELRARQNQVVLLVRGKTDGMPVLEEAFGRVTLAAS